MAKKGITKTKKAETSKNVDTVRASRAGHTFHERWAARRALQLVFPQDGLTAIAVEGLSSNEKLVLNKEAEDIADLVFYYGGDKFENSVTVQTAQFKYKTTPGEITASYLKKTIEKFASSMAEYDKRSSPEQVNKRLLFSFVTNARLSSELSAALTCLKVGKNPTDEEALRQSKYLSELCSKKGIEAKRLFMRTEFRAAEDNLPTQNNKLRRTMADWSAGADTTSRARLFELTELMREKAGPRGQANNLVRREDILDALNCEPEDLFPAETRFIEVGDIVARSQLDDVAKLLNEEAAPIFIHAEGGVGKTVFVQSLAATMLEEYEVVIYDCFGGGAYRSLDQARHRPNVGLVQIINELASRGLCDPLLPGDADSLALVKAARRRFSQAALAIKLQSKKLGVLIIIDAADNAQLEADNRREDAFPSLLLASIQNMKIEGFKLVLTARTHRMANVIKRSEVLPFQLKTFAAEEARLFLSSRRTNLSNAEFAKAFSRSEGNARVLAYLVDTWEPNVAIDAPDGVMTVETLISQKCQKIFNDLHIVGWLDEEINEFFAAISLLPPPIPLDELATALGWQYSQVKGAVSDLTPMLEVVPHGAIFRDEPTETYVLETYSTKEVAQQAIAQRLMNAQKASNYAAEALPNFLVAINDCDRSYALANSVEFPVTAQSDFGRRRLQLARLNAAFKLAVKKDDTDRVLRLTMRLAQVSAANNRGDELIRRSPSLAVSLGDYDAYRRLFVDRAGWRGARDARLTVAHAFSNEMEEAEIHNERAIGWINWSSKQPREEFGPSEPAERPGKDDFASVIFLDILNKNFSNLDNNLVSWNLKFSLSVLRVALKLSRQFELITGNFVIDDLARFAVTAACKSFALKITLLKSSAVSTVRRKALANSLQKLPSDKKRNDDGSYDPESRTDADIIYASFAALIHKDDKSCAKIISSAKMSRPSAYDYGERYGFHRIWLPTLYACCSAWGRSRRVEIYDFLPREVKITSKVKDIKSFDDLKKYLSALPAPRQKNQRETANKKSGKSLFSDRDCREISRGIANIMRLLIPVETVVLSKTSLTEKVFSDFVSNWVKELPSKDYGHEEEAHVVITRTVGLGIVKLLLLHSDAFSKADVQTLIGVVSGNRFRRSEKSAIIALIASKRGLEVLAGDFAGKIAEDIRKDDSIDQRGQDYARLADALLEMSLHEARKYYRDGLAELDKLGSNDYELIYGLLKYASVQKGGPIVPHLAHRLMNLSQTICHQEPSKFGWALFGKACAGSVGISAITKLLRWSDQDVAPFSYGLPQLVCFLVEHEQLHPKVAAAILLLCEDHGWHDWRIGDGLRALLRKTAIAGERQEILAVTIAKLKEEHSSGGWPSVWKSLSEIETEFPDLLSLKERASLNELSEAARCKQDKANRGLPSDSLLAESSLAESSAKNSTISIIDQLLVKCDPTSASDLDDAVRAIKQDGNLPYNTKHSFFSELRGEACPYNDRWKHLLAISNASAIDINEAIDFIAECLVTWNSSSTYVNAEIKQIIQNLFEQKGSQFFNLRYSSMSRELERLAVMCGDRDFIVGLVLKTIVNEKLELDGNEWLQLATSICSAASMHASREALEDFLSGPAGGIADEIGEGAYEARFSTTTKSLLAEILFHLLGNSDAYIRWTAARSISWLTELGLIDDLDILLNHFDVRAIPALTSSGQQLAFENSQQWLLMGLARAAFYHEAKLGALTSKMFELAARDDIHVLNKRHILRFFCNVRVNEKLIAALKKEVSEDPKGTIEAAGWPKATASKSSFKFEYEFGKHEVSQLARLFWISDGESVDAIADEIRKKWPDATDMDYFPGQDRYRRDRSDRYEFYRESLQKHALLGAATTLRKIYPIARQNCDEEDCSPFEEFIRDYDITFPDGSWLADHKDEIPLPAQASFLGPRIKSNEAIVDAKLVIEQLALNDGGVMVPICGSWRSPDGVNIRIVTGLGKRRGIVKECLAFSKLKDYELWMPTFWPGGYDNDHRQKSPFEPFIWARDSYGIGIDEGDRMASKGPITRSRLGIKLTDLLNLMPDKQMREWKAGKGNVVLRSQVWGEWMPVPDDYRNHQHNDGEILWANRGWLDQALQSLDRQLVYIITLTKYKERHSYEESGAKAVYIATTNSKSGLRTWYAKNASAKPY